MKRTQVSAVTGNPQRACCDSLNRLQRIHDIQQRDVFRRVGQLETAIGSALRRQQSGLHQRLHQFGQIRPGNAGNFGNFARRAGLSPAAGDYQNCSKCIFDGLTNHETVTNLEFRQPRSSCRMMPQGNHKHCMSKHQAVSLSREAFEPARAIRRPDSGTTSPLFRQLA